MSSICVLPDGLSGVLKRMQAALSEEGVPIASTHALDAASAKVHPDAFGCLKNPHETAFFGNGSCHVWQDQLKTFPPTLILTAGKDSLCKEAELFRDKLREAGVNVTHKQFESSPHGFALSDRPDAKEGWQMMINHLKLHLFTHSMNLVK